LGAITVVLLLVVCLALLGTMREVVILQGKVSAFTDLLLEPPTPQFLDGVLPTRVSATLRDAHVGQAGNCFLIFVRQGCSGCAGLLQDLKQALAIGVLSPGQVACVVGPQSGGLETRVRAMGITVLIDHDRLLSSGCGIKHSPTTFLLAAESLNVLDASVGGGFAWIQSRLSPAAAAARLTASADSRPSA
jgi:hypothetical protein